MKRLITATIAALFIFFLPVQAESPVGADPPTPGDPNGSFEQHTPHDPNQPKEPPGLVKKLSTPPAPLSTPTPANVVHVVILVPFGFHNERVGYLPAEGYWEVGGPPSLWWWGYNWTWDLDYYMNYWTVRAFDYDVTVHYSQRNLSYLQNGRQDSCGEGADWGRVWQVLQQERPDLDSKQLWVAMLGAGGFAGGGSVANQDGTISFGRMLVGDWGFKNYWGYTRTACQTQEHRTDYSAKTWGHEAWHALGDLYNHTPGCAIWLWETPCQQQVDDWIWKNPVTLYWAPCWIWWWWYGCG